MQKALLCQRFTRVFRDRYALSPRPLCPCLRDRYAPKLRTHPLERDRYAPKCDRYAPRFHNAERRCCGVLWITSATAMPLFAGYGALSTKARDRYAPSRGRALSYPQKRDRYAPRGAQRSRIGGFEALAGRGASWARRCAPGASLPHRLRRQGPPRPASARPGGIAVALRCL